MSEIKVTFSNGVKCSVSDDLAERLGPTFKAAGGRARGTQRAAANKPARAATAAAKPAAKRKGKTPAAAAPPAVDSSAAEADDKTQAPAVPAEADGARPSAEWTAEQLTAFAEENDIDLAGATKQPDILAAIDAFLAEDDDEDDDEGDDESDDENE